MTRRVQALNAGLAILFGLVALAVAYWGIVGASDLLARDDNPRLVEAELRVQRGSILDRNGIVLAETVGDLGELERVYNGFGVYSPAVGYYSLRHGVSGVEDSYDDVLRGRESDPWRAWWQGFVHRNPVGQDVQLTLDAQVQAVADAALGVSQGAVVLLDARSGDILVLVSHPNYDPNELDAQFDVLSADEDAPLLSRATQALYQPGTALQPLILAAALEAGVAPADTQFEELTEPVMVGEAWLGCLASPPDEEGTIATALAHSCPAPFVALGAGMEAAALERLGLYEPPPVPMEVVAGSRPELSEDGFIAPGEAAGQGQLTLSPLQMAWAMAALANEGKLSRLRLVRRIGSGGIVVAEQVLMRGITPGTADLVTGMMMEGVAAGAAAEAAIDGVEVAGHVGVAIAGPEGERNSWFLGIAPATKPEPFARYVVVVLMEGTPDPAAAARVGRQVLESVLDGR